MQHVLLRLLQIEFKKKSVVTKYLINEPEMIMCLSKIKLMLGNIN